MTWTFFWKICSFALYFANIILVISVVWRLVMKKSDPMKTLTWIVVLILLPYIGLILYLLVGQNYRKDAIFKNKRIVDIEVRKKLALNQLHHYKDLDNLAASVSPYKKLIRQNLLGNYSILTVIDKIDFYFSGKEALDAMIADMESATQHIHLQSFIYMDDIIGTRIRDILVEKAANGVEVRLIYDSFGSFKAKRRFFKEMRNAGVEVLEFSPVRIFKPTHKINYRNHRKILVVDGRVGYIGGINIADRYYDGGIYEEWRDTQIRVEGEAVFPMQSSFLLDRYFTINRHLTRRRKYYADIDIENIYRHKAATDIYSQFLTSGPDSDWSSIKGSYFSMITGASRRICINTPYFTPSESLIKAIRTASLGGVEVNLMMPARSDSTLIHYCSMSYIKELLRAGVNVYLFKCGFIHSKSITVDGQICMVGSANMDNRSMLYDFEVMSVIYNPQCAAILEEQFDKDISKCEKISLPKWEKRGYKEKLFEGLSRLVSPML